MSTRLSGASLLICSPVIPAWTTWTSWSLRTGAPRAIPSTTPGCPRSQHLARSRPHRRLGGCAWRASSSRRRRGLRTIWFAAWRPIRCPTPATAGVRCSRSPPPARWPTTETSRVAGSRPRSAARTRTSFLGLVERRFFDGTRWHRVVPNFVVQDGDPRGDGWGGPGAGFVLRDEINPVRYDVGTVGMALSGPNTGGSQYFITHSAQPHLDGIYTIFGRVVGGVDVLNAIGMGDRIRSIHR